MPSAPERGQLGAVAARVDGDVDEGRAGVRESPAERRLERVAGADFPGLATEAAGGGGEIDGRAAHAAGRALLALLLDVDQRQRGVVELDKLLMDAKKARPRPKRKAARS